MTSFNRRSRLSGTIFIIVVLLVAFGQSDWLRTGTKNAERYQPGLYTVDEAVDGDTIIVNMNGKREIVRMIGVDTPETHHPSRPIECFGLEASEYTRTLLEDKRVRLQADPLDTNRDRYERLLRYVYLPDGTLFEEQLIKNGYGFAYTLFPFEKAEQFKTLQEEAQSAKEGFWGKCEVSEDNGAFHTNPAN